MKWNCELIQDLLPLYEEGLCSPASHAAVEEHLRECAACRRLSKPLPIEEPEPLPAEDRTVARSMRRVRRRWLRSLLAAVLIVPLLLMCINQYRGSGVCFTNLDDILIARRFLAALEKEDWDTAAKMHEYASDYESILDALSMSEQEWGPSFTPISIGGEAYAIKTYLVRDYGAPETAADLFGFLYNRQGLAMISPALWERVCAIEPGAVTDLDGWKQELNGEWYANAATEWGNYITTEGRKFATAGEYCNHFDLVPLCVYEEARSELEAEAKLLHDSTHAAYGYVADMTEAEFIEYMERRYAEDLRSLEDSVTFDCTGFRGGYLSGDNEGWHIQFGVTLTHQGKPLDTTMAIGVEDGKVFVASIGYTERVDWLDELDRALYPSAHPDY